MKLTTHACYSSMIEYFILVEEEKGTKKKVEQNTDILCCSVEGNWWCENFLLFFCAFP